MANEFRKLDTDEARKILSIDQAAKFDAKQTALNAWPGSYNLRLLAEAVNNRRSYVEFEPKNKRFSIRYDDIKEVVFIKPADTDNGFVPCGWFNYSKLKDALNNE